MTEWKRIGRDEDVLRQAGVAGLVWGKDPLQNELIMAAQRVADLESQVAESVQRVRYTVDRVMENLSDIQATLQSFGPLQSEGPRFDVLVCQLAKAREELARQVSTRQSVLVWMEELEARQSE
jgi:hypothetical protein